MKTQMRLKIFVLLTLAVFVSQNAWACRFWAAVGASIPQELVTSQLLTEPQALKKLGEDAPNGWSVGSVKGSDAQVLRGIQPAAGDDKFDAAVKEIASKDAQIIFSHVRKATSGCVDVDDPHPFTIEKNGKKWFFAHNGGVDKQLLIDLIGEEYLNNNKPQICAGSQDTWIDSELLFIFLMKKIEENKWDVTRGLKDGLVDIYLNTETNERFLNFFLTDGETLWAFRKGESLSYHYDYAANRTIIASSIPSADSANWYDVDNDNIITVTVSQAPDFTPLFDKVRKHQSY